MEDLEDLITTIIVLALLVGVGYMVYRWLKPPPENEPIGIVTRKQDVVQHGRNEGSLREVSGTEDLYRDDVLRVSDGGEGLLDFGDELQLRLFNDTGLNITEWEEPPDRPPIASFFVHKKGGCTGKVYEGAKATIITPTGVEVTVLGTRFFVIYNHHTEQTAAGNFDGTVEVASGGSSVSLKVGYYVVANADQPPGQQHKIPFTMDEFERRARDLKSPVNAFGETAGWKEVVVEKPVIKTVIVEKEVVVKETVVVEKEVVITPTPPPPTPTPVTGPDTDAGVTPGLTYTVHLGDSLESLAEKFLGNASAAAAIIYYTNLKHAEDPTYAFLSSAALSSQDFFHPGCKIYIPGEEEAAKFLEARVAGAVTVLGVWGGDEFDAFSEAVAPFTKETGIEMEFESVSWEDLPAMLTAWVEAGNPPDIAILPPGQMYELAEKGVLVDISTFMDMEQLHSDYAQTWLNLGSYRGALYSIPIGVRNKSLIWYNPTAFAEAGYEVPTAWDELIALSYQIVADGGVPWCIGVESGAASGWPATDWIEDIMLRTAGPEIYDKWVAHEIPWTDPAIETAWEYFGQIAANEDYVYGGTTAVLVTNFVDSPAPMFDSPCGCYMHRQASWITGIFPEGLVAGEDYDFFPFPPIDPAYGTPVLGWASLIVMFNDTPQARAFMEYLATPTPEAQWIWAARGWLLSPNKWLSPDVHPDVYPDALTMKMAEMVFEAEVFRFDASDLMPEAVWGSFWKSTLDYISGEDLDMVLATIEASAVEAYK